MPPTYEITTIDQLINLIQGTQHPEMLLADLIHFFTLHRQAYAAGGEQPARGFLWTDDGIAGMGKGAE